MRCCIIRLYYIHHFIEFAKVNSTVIDFEVEITFSNEAYKLVKFSAQRVLTHVYSAVILS